MEETLEEELHRLWHREQHQQLDILVARFIMETEKLPSKTTLLEFMEWSHSKTIKKK